MRHHEQNETWLIRLASAEFKAAQFVGLGGMASYASLAGDTWVKLTAPASLVRSQLLALPGERWQEVEGRLYTAASRVPARRTPTCEWVSANAWFQTELPRAGVAGRFGDAYRREICLVRGGVEKQPVAIKTNIDALSDWTASAADQHLSQLRWLTSSREPATCLVMGRPLPLVPGKLFVESERVLYPAGFCWQPNVDPRTVRQVFGVPAGDWLYLESNDNFQVIADDLFTGLTRGSVRSCLSD